MEFFQLREGYNIPVVGFGPDEMGYSPRRKKLKMDIVHKGFRKIKKKIYDEPKYVNQIVSGFHAGYILLDWSSTYGDGKLIMKGMQKSGLKREDMFLTTRVSNKAQFKGNVSVNSLIFEIVPIFSEL